MKNRYISILTALIIAVTSISINGKAFAYNEFYSSNDILFYDENACSTSSPPSNITTSSSGYSRLKEAVKTYGQSAMNMQREYGSPWEIVLAQMQKESGTGTAGIAVSGATNNWLGITGEGDAGSWTSSTGRKWAKYTTVEASVKDWAGPRVLRNGYYDTAFSSLDPSNYNLDTFLTEMLSHYAPNSDGNNESSYKKDVLSFINGPIASVRAEMGWPSSAELARTENIPIGGKNPIGTITSTTTTSAPDNGCGDSGSGSAHNGDINKTAIVLAWPDRTHSKNDPKPEYKTALAAVGLNKYGDPWVNIGASCDAYVTTVMRYSGVDTDFKCCGTTNQLSYLRGSSKYKEIPNLGNTSNLQPGDIFILEGHIMMYIKLDDGTEKIAAASYGDRTADYKSGMFYSDNRGSYHIFRYIGGGSQ
jgi:hypothetical protein